MAYYKRYHPEKFPDESYPVLYKAYYLFGEGGQEDKYRVVNIYGLEDPTDALNALMEVYHNYYNLTFNSDVLYEIPIIYNPTPYTLTFIIVYKVNGIDYYIWEYLSIWENIKTLIQNKPIIF